MSAHAPVDWRALRDKELGVADRGSSGSGPSVQANLVTSGASTNHILAFDRLSGMSCWILDTGSSNHVTDYLSCLEAQCVIQSRNVGLPNGQQVASLVMGSDRSLRTTIGVGELRDGLYWICAGARTSVVHIVSDTGSLVHWYQRMGHPSNKVFKAIPFASSFNFNKHSVCDTCHFAKQHRSNFTLNDKRASDMFELIHCDLWRPHRIVSSRGAKYFFTIVDDYSRATWVHLLLDKTEVIDMFMNFLSMVSTQFYKTVKCVQSDNGNEFNYLETESYFVSRDVVFHESLFPFASPVSSSPSSDSLVSLNVPFNGTPDTDGASIEGKGAIGAAMATTGGAAAKGDTSVEGAVSGGVSGSNAETEPAAVTSNDEPPTFKEAIRDSKWCAAMKDEIDALERNETWELTDLPYDKKALGCRWVYNIKYKSDGTIERFKARLVVFGNHQVEGLDYGDFCSCSQDGYNASFLVYCCYKEVVIAPNGRP
ncbi:uncharacterized protein LOC141608440 [Silene latifolia]|uniref:uncharacterized protein LOC141608440 n=1 Tax=Silene latifolia TaxID=37657 RepID=UPI003D78732A